MLKSLLVASILTFGCSIARDEIWPPSPGVTPRNFARIRPGMCQSDVTTKILGMQDRDPTIFVSGGIYVTWRGRDYTATVQFGPYDGVVLNGTCRRNDRSEPPRSFGLEDSLLKRLRHRLGL